MTDNVVSLRGEPVVSKALCEDVIVGLEFWLDRAKAGEISGVALVANYVDGSIGSTIRGVVSTKQIGEMFCLSMKISERVKA